MWVVTSMTLESQNAVDRLLPRLPAGAQVWGNQALRYCSVLNCLRSFSGTLKEKWPPVSEYPESGVLRGSLITLRVCLSSRRA